MKKLLFIALIFINKMSYSASEGNQLTDALYALNFEEIIRLLTLNPDLKLENLNRSGGPHPYDDFDGKKIEINIHDPATVLLFGTGPYKQQGVELIKVILELRANHKLKEYLKKLFLNKDIVESITDFSNTNETFIEKGNLHCAVMNDNAKVVELLLKKSADVNEKIKYHNTDNRDKHVTPLRLLMEQSGGGVALDSVSNRLKGYKIFFAKPEIVKLLLDYGASLETKDSDGKTALDIAKEHDELKEETRILEAEATDRNQRSQKLNKELKVPLIKPLIDLIQDYLFTK